MTGDINSLAAEGAERILLECLKLERGDILTFFCDETTAVPARFIADAAQRLGIKAHRRELSFAEQAGFNHSTGLPDLDRELLEASRGILTCLSNDPSCTSYRAALLSAGTTAGVRFGHMPGIDLWVLASAVNIDYMAAEQRCDDLALALALGEHALLETFGEDGAEHLEFGLGGLKRAPISSTGRIPIGTWGNIPGGETFIAPIEDTAEGVFVLNGSFKGQVLQTKTSLRLSFGNGRLLKLEGPAAVCSAFDALLEPGRRQGDRFFDCLAEFGIGVNPGIPELTGNALFDEKCDGTVHIALGDSMRYGGRQSSLIHEDLVTRRPSLWIDGHPILDRGHNVFDPAVWRDRLDDTPVADAISAGSLSVRRTGIRAILNQDTRRLVVQREVASGRICSYMIGDGGTSPVLALIYELVTPLPAFTSVDDIVHNAGLINVPGPLVRPGLTILLRHQLIEMVRPGQNHA